MEEKDKKETESAGSEAVSGEKESAETEGHAVPDSPDEPMEAKEAEPAEAAGDTAAEASDDTAAEPEKEHDPVSGAESDLHEAAQEQTDENDRMPVMVAEDVAEPAVPVQASNSSKVWPIVSLVLAVLLVIVLIKPPFASPKAEAVATVNGVEITKDQLYEQLAKSGGAQTLDSLIDEELINQEAQKEKITVSEADIDAEIESIKTQFGSEDMLNQALMQYGMTMDDLREQTATRLTLTKLLEPQITVTDEQIKETFEANKEALNTPEQVRASVILVETEQEANDIIKQLKEGADFAELAKSKSLDTATKDQGGDTDFFARGQKEEAVEEAAFKLAKDEISGAVKTSAGYQVIKVTDRKEAHTATLEEKKEEIRSGLISQQVSSMSGTWLQDLRGKSQITNTLTDTDTDTTAAQ